MYVNASVARIFQGQGRPWKIRVEYRGYNPDNKSERSDKFWEIEWNGGSPVYCNYGAIGSEGLRRPIEYSSSEAMTKLIEKMRKGYSYSKGTVDTVPLEPPKKMAELPEPYRLIKRLEGMGGGLYRALDGAGNLVMEMDATGADALATFNPWITVSH
jgi:predicted DNA-binding WGR domain protein